MIQADNTLAALNLVTGSWQTQFGSLVISFYAWIYYSDWDSKNVMHHNKCNTAVQSADGIGNVSPELSNFIHMTAIYQIIYHTYALLIKLIGLKSKTTFTKFRNSLLLSLSFLSVLSLARCSRCIFLYKWCEVQPIVETEGFLFFLLLEIVGFFAYVIANIIFLVTRSFTKHKLPVEPEIPDEKRLPDCDFMIGCFAIADTFINATYPFICSALKYLLPGQVNTESNAANVKILTLFAVIASSFTFITSFFMTFVSWNAGPNCWKKCAPLFYFGSSIVVYVILPFVYCPWVLISLAPGVDAYKTITYTWCLNYCSILAAQFVTFFIEIRQRFYRQWLFYKAVTQKNALHTVTPLLNEQGADQKIIKEKVEALAEIVESEEREADTSYRLQQRKMGEGKIRVGMFLDHTDEIYTLAFMSQLKAKIILQYVDLFTGLEIDENEDPETKNRDANGKLVAFSDREFHTLIYTPDSELDEFQKELKKEAKLKVKEILVNKRVFLFGNALICFASQSFLTALILGALLEDDLSRLFNPEYFTIMMLARYVCSLILHMSQLDEVARAQINMKYATNHTYMFQSWFLAYFMALLQFIITFLVELICVFVIIVQNSPLNVVLNFISLAVIADFDCFIYEAQIESLKFLIEREEPILRIRHTTSSRCKSEELSEFENELGERPPIRLLWIDRTWQNKLGYIVYKFCRVLYVSFYFYFMPYLTVICGTVFPLLYYEYHTDFPL